MAKKTQQRNTSDGDRVEQYAQDVVSGAIVSGPHVRAACERHLNDLKGGATRGLYFDSAAAERAIGFFRDVLRLNGGEFEGKPYELLPWQAFIVGSLFGWKGRDGFRRFRVAYVETGKGSGKSPAAAGIGLYGLVADDEPRAEVYSAATKKDQAMILFRDAVAMVDQSPALCSRIRKSGTGLNAWNLAYLEKGSFFRPISADDGQSGPRPHIALVDEIHEHKTNVVVELLRAGTKSRRQAIIFMITNSGAGKTTPCWGYHDYGAKVAAGVLQDDSFFSYVCALDEGDDPFNDEDCWQKANPSLAYGLPGIKYLREQVTQARQMPSKEAIVRRLNFCQWTDAEAPWISGEVWENAGRKFDWRDLRGRRAWGGLDLSSTTDLTGLVLWIEPEADSEPWLMVPYCWLPDDALKEKEDADRVPYLSWKADGYLHTTPGRAVSKLAVARFLAGLTNHFDIQGVAYDRWRFDDLIQITEDEGITLPPIVSYGQGYKDMAPAIETFEAALLNGNVVHPCNPVFTWNAANAVTVSDDAGNRKLSKNRATGRIDLMVAAVMGARLALGTREEESDNGYFDNIIIK